MNARIRIAAVPYRLQTLIPAKGLHFTESRDPDSSVDEIRLAIADREIFHVPSFDCACAKNGVDHRLTGPKARIHLL